MAFISPAAPGSSAWAQVAMPESLFDPSFQMSFAGVIGLVALVEANSLRRKERPEDVSFIFRWLHRLWTFVVGDTVTVTTLIATPAVAPFAI
jgi:competence protein ComEC